MEVSIIIPVYNAQDYLQDCLDSIARQTYQDFEVIMINDGSTDKSLELIIQQSQKDKRFKVISQANAGVSTTRNKGISLSKGKYICFVDADDMIEENFISCMIAHISTNDLAITGAQYTDNANHTDILPQGQYKKKDIGKLLEVNLKSICLNAVWGKFFYRDIIIKNNIYFDSKLIYGEDAEFFHKYLKYCSSIYVDEGCKYIYRFEHENFDHLRKFKMSAASCTYHITKIAQAYYDICNKFTFTNNDYLQTMTRLRMLCYDASISRYNKYDISLLFSLKEVKKCFKLRKRYSRFNLLQNWLITLHLYTLCSILCNINKKIII